MTCTLIITTKNEEGSIGQLLESILNQTKTPDEVIIADAGSADDTRKIVKQYQRKLPLRLIELPGGANRAVGRNRAIAKASNEIILITDAGCRLDPNWVREMLRPFADKKTNVVAGYYRSESNNTFEACQIPYILVMPDRYDPKSFLPATRSMGIQKSVWKSMGGFKEASRYAEDYIFARVLRQRGYVIVSAPKAIVIWRPRATLAGFFRMIREHAQGDAFNGAWRGKVVSIFGRYLVLLAFPILFFPYFLYTIWKNYHYVRQPLAFYFLPLLQITSDIAVMWGTLAGLSARIQQA